MRIDTDATIGWKPQKMRITPIHYARRLAALFEFFVQSCNHLSSVATILPRTPVGITHHDAPALMLNHLVTRYRFRQCRGAIPVLKSRRVHNLALEFLRARLHPTSQNIGNAPFLQRLLIVFTQWPAVGHHCEAFHHIGLETRSMAPIEVSPS